MIVVHEVLGQAYVSLVKHIFGLIPDNIAIVEVNSHDNTEVIQNKLNLAIAKFNSDMGTLILTDVFGATPCNLARKLVKNDKTILLTGLNAPMMIKAIQNAPLRTDVRILAEEVKVSALSGIITIQNEDKGNSI